MSEDNSVTHWLEGVKAGDDADIQRLWDRYFESLVRLAGARLPGYSRRVFDGEDVALSAFHSFCDRVGQGQFPILANRDDLWRLLATITSRKALERLRHENRAKRGGGRVLGESAVISARDAAFLSREPSPDDAAQFADEFTRLFNRLEDETLKTIARKKLEGEETDRIAADLGVSTRTVDRKLRLIREIWSDESP